MNIVLLGDDKLIGVTNSVDIDGLCTDIGDVIDCLIVSLLVFVVVVFVLLLSLLSILSPFNIDIDDERLESIILT